MHEMHVACRILVHLHAFNFFQPPHLHNMVCPLSGWKQIVKTIKIYSSFHTFVHFHQPVRLNYNRFISKPVFYFDFIAGPDRSVGCAVRLVFRRSWVRSSGPAPSFVEIWSWNNFYGHSLPTADSSRAVVSYWRRYGHYTIIALVWG